LIGVSLVQRLMSVARVANHRLLIAILLVAFIVVLTMSAAIRRGHAVMIGQGDQTRPLSRLRRSFAPWPLHSPERPRSHGYGLSRAAGAGVFIILLGLARRMTAQSFLA
jgi:hypothetical protein